MKINRLFIWALAVTAAVASCENKIAPEQTPDGSDAPAQTGFTFTATTESDSSQPQAKATIGLNDNNKVQTFWEDGDKISVYSSANSSSNVNYVFSTSLENNATSAQFSYNGETEFLTGDRYLAIYPYATSTSRAISLTEAKIDSEIPARYDGDAYRMSMVDVPQSQTLVAGGFDRSAAVAIALAEGNTTLNFKNAVSLIKFKVADADVVSGSIVASDKISGRYRADILAADGTPMLMEYSGNGISQYNSVGFAAPENSPLSTTAEYYVAVRPTELTSGFSVVLNGTPVKEYTLEAFERNKIYDLGTLTIPEQDENTKVLFFDFTGEIQNPWTPVAGELPPSGSWPTNKGYLHKDGGVECVYTLNGIDYTFVLADCNTASATNAYWSTKGYIALNAQYRYLGLPAIEGYALSKVICNNAKLQEDTSNNTPKMGITKIITAKAAHPTEDDFVSGGEYQTWVNGGGESYTYTLEGTAANTMYYLYAKVKGAVATLELTYEKVN